MKNKKNKIESNEVGRKGDGKGKRKGCQQKDNRVLCLAK
jgi:hypothetical protein